VHCVIRPKIYYEHAISNIYIADFDLSKSPGTMNNETAIVYGNYPDFIWKQMVSDGIRLAEWDAVREETGWFLKPA